MSVKQLLVLGVIGALGYYWYSTQYAVAASPVKALPIRADLAQLMKLYSDQGWEVRANGDVRNPTTGQTLNIEGKTVTSF